MTESLSPHIALALFENAPLPVLVLDCNDRVLVFNAAFASMVGTNQASTLTGCTAAQIGSTAIQALLGGNTRVSWSDDATATPQYFEIQCVALPDGAHARLFVDISREISLDGQLRQHVLTDGNTGLLNQRGIMLALEPQVARSRRYNRPISVVLLDANLADKDSDSRLQIAQMLKDQLRWADLVGCNDQHQFLLVLPETDISASEQLLEKLQQRLQTLTSAAASIHFGVATWQQNDSAISLLARAANALAHSRGAASTTVVGL